MVHLLSGMDPHVCVHGAPLGEPLPTDLALEGTEANVRISNMPPQVRLSSERS